MTLECPSCGAENPDGAEYCNLCFESMGFYCTEYTEAVSSNDGYMPDYPSSFEQRTDVVPGAGPPLQRGDPPPVDIGTYGSVTGYEAETPPLQPHPPASTLYGDIPDTAKERVFPWNKALLEVLKAALIAALLSVLLEFILGFIGIGAITSGSFTAGMTLILLALLIPVALGGFWPGYRMEAYGWLLGLMAVVLWAFALRPLYYAILGWMLSEKFTFAFAVDKASLAFIIFLFLPVGALAGWLGEKRATTGLKL